MVRENLNSEEKYLEMISGKTAAMFTTCARTGALLSGASKEIIDYIRSFAPGFIFTT